MVNFPGDIDILGPRRRAFLSYQTSEGAWSNNRKAQTGTSLTVLLEWSTLAVLLGMVIRHDARRHHFKAQTNAIDAIPHLEP